MSLLEIENIKVQNDTQLAYYEHILEHLASTEVSMLTDWRDILSIITLIIAVGAMIITYIQLIISNTQNIPNKVMKYAKVAVMIILTAVIIYAGYGQWSIYKTEKNISLVKEKVINAIECYKKSKGESK